MATCAPRRSRSSWPSGASLGELHEQLYGDVVLGGEFRPLESSIGVAPEQIAVELHTSLGNIRCRWKATEGWDPHEVGIAVHAELVRIHPFTDGNGRSTRLLADLVFVATQELTEPALYDRNVDRRRYIALLQENDQYRNPSDLAAFVGTQPFGE